MGTLGRTIVMVGTMMPQLGSIQMLQGTYTPTILGSYRMSYAPPIEAFGTVIRQDGLQFVKQKDYSTNLSDIPISVSGEFKRKVRLIGGANIENTSRENS